MSTMIERMARAICAEDPFVSAKGALPWDDVSKHGKDRLRKNARAALTAMLEPTEAMLEAGIMFDIDNGRGGFVNLRDDEVSQIHRELIQAALDEG